MHFCLYSECDVNKSSDRSECEYYLQMWFGADLSPGLVFWSGIQGLWESTRFDCC